MPHGGLPQGFTVCLARECLQASVGMNVHTNKGYSVLSRPTKLHPNSCIASCDFIFLIFFAKDDKIALVWFCISVTPFPDTRLRCHP